MSEHLFSPGPYQLVCREPNGKRDEGGHLVLDALGDSIAALAYRTGDHPAEEQCANAQLLAASWDLLAAAKLGRAAIAEDLNATIEAHSILDPGSLKPDLNTLDDVARPIVNRLTAQLDQVDAAIAAAEGRS